MGKTEERKAVGREMNERFRDAESGESRKAYLESLPVAGLESLRTLATTRFGRKGSSWIHTASKDVLIRAILAAKPAEASEVPTAPVVATSGVQRPSIPTQTTTNGTAGKIGAAVLGAIESAIGDLESRIEASEKQQIDEDEIARIAKNSIDFVSLLGSIKDTCASELANLLEKTPVVKVQSQTGKVVTVAGQHSEFPRLLAQIAAGNKTWVVGPAGSGKTTACEKIAESLGMELFIQPPAVMNFDVLGHRDASGKIHGTQFSDWCRFQGDAILVIDEIDSWFESAQMAANLALANGYAVLPEGKVNLTCDGKYRKVVVATANTFGHGGTSSYVGRRTIDGALRNRFESTIFWGYDEAFETRLASAIIDQTPADDANKDAARKIVPEIHRARKKVADRAIKAIVSPRQTFAAVRLILAGASTLDQVWDETILGSIDSADLRKELRGIR